MRATLNHPIKCTKTLHRRYKHKILSLSVLIHTIKTKSNIILLQLFGTCQKGYCWSMDIWHVGTCQLKQYSCRRHVFRTIGAGPLPHVSRRSRDDPAGIPWRGLAGRWRRFSIVLRTANPCKSPPKTSKSLTIPLNFADGGVGGDGGDENVWAPSF